jgi:hypothetical protein
MSANAADSSPANIFVTKVLMAGFAMSYFNIVIVAIIDIYFGLGMNPDLGLLAVVWVYLWSFPTAFYLLYHSVTLPLPQWPVTFGGVLPKVCENSTLTLGMENVDPRQDWPCFPAHLKDRIANLAGPEGWRYLIEVDGRIMICLFLVLNIAMLAWTVAVARRPWKEGDPALGCIELASQSKVDAELSELEDLEKQQRAA